MAVLVTGGAGYIGSHMTYLLGDHGIGAVVLDNLSTGTRANVAPSAVFIEGDVGDGKLLRRIIIEHRISAVIHFAGSVVVPESVERPLLYYGNNTAASRTLIEACVETGVRNFIFSSTAAVYGLGGDDLIGEDAPTQPINPYGRSKLMIESILSDAAEAHDLRFIVLRYFNVAGADPKGRTGQSTPRATHLIKRAAQVATGQIPYLDIFGTDYPTPDGTGIRDYIHVSDLADLHLHALRHLEAGGRSASYNCGYGRGHSVREVISAFEQVTGKALPARERPRRAGDPPRLVADTSRIRREFHWQPKFDELEGIVRSALAWESRLAP
jgi:UDP-glucose 4-epimerase